MIYALVPSPTIFTLRLSAARKVIGASCVPLFLGIRVPLYSPGKKITVSPGLAPLLAFSKLAHGASSVPGLLSLPLEATK